MSWRPIFASWMTALTSLFYFIYLFFFSFLIDDHVSNFIVREVDRNLTTIILPFTKLVSCFTQYLSTSAISPLLNRTKKIIPLTKSNFCQNFIWLFIFLFIFCLFVSYWFITYLYFNLFSLLISSANYRKKKNSCKISQRKYSNLGITKSHLVKSKKITISLINPYFLSVTFRTRFFFRVSIFKLYWEKIKV